MWTRLLVVLICLHGRRAHQHIHPHKLCKLVSWKCIFCKSSCKGVYWLHSYILLSFVSNNCKYDVQTFYGNHEHGQVWRGHSSWAELGSWYTMQEWSLPSVLSQTVAEGTLCKLDHVTFLLKWKILETASIFQHIWSVWTSAKYCYFKHDSS